MSGPVNPWTHPLRDYKGFSPCVYFAPRGFWGLVRETPGPTKFRAASWLEVQAAFEAAVDGYLAAQAAGGGG